MGTDGRTTCAKTMIPTGRDFGSAEWINNVTMTMHLVVSYIRNMFTIFHSIHRNNIPAHSSDFHMHKQIINYESCIKMVSNDSKMLHVLSYKLIKIFHQV